MHPEFCHVGLREWMLRESLNEALRHHAKLYAMTSAPPESVFQDAGFEEVGPATLDLTRHGGESEMRRTVVCHDGGQSKQLREGQKVVRKWAMEERWECSVLREGIGI